MNHWRRRPTLTLGRVLVMTCETHGCSFTLYPITLAPYLRAAVQDVLPDGRSPATTEGSDEVASKPTAFAVAAEAHEKRKWVSSEDKNRQESHLRPGEVPSWRASRVRQLERLERWLGLSEELSDGERVERAAVLGVEALELKEASRTEVHATVSGRGRAILQILEAVSHRGRETSACRLERLLWAGHHAGLWGRPWFWSPAAARYRDTAVGSRSFRWSRPGPSAAPDAGGNRPTSLLVARQEPIS